VRPLDQGQQFKVCNIAQCHSSHGDAKPPMDSPVAAEGSAPEIQIGGKLRRG
jgi:hypothetical protein